MIDSYTKIMYEGSDEEPIRCTFYDNGYHITIRGEGGNRHLILNNEKPNDKLYGCIDLWVDTHCAANEAFIHSVSIGGEPGARFTKYIIDLLHKYAYKVESWCYRYNFAGLDRLFAEIYRDMMNDGIPKF